MTNSIYQFKMVVDGIYVEYSTSDKEAMYDFLGSSISEEHIKKEEEIPKAIEHLTRFLKGEKG